MPFFRQETPVEPVLTCRNLVKFLGAEESRVQVLKSVSLDLYPQRVYAVVGPSGCGKSSLLYLLGLLDTPDGGEIIIHNKQVAHLTTTEADEIRNRYIGFVFQFHFLIKEFTALENVMLPMKKLGVLREEEMQARAHQLLDMVGLATKAHRHTNHLSGGEQQRVAIARALANKPQIILADEPTGNLDTENSDKVFAMLKELVHREKMTLLMVTHNPEIAQKSDEIIEMRDGYLV